VFIIIFSGDERKAEEIRRMGGIRAEQSSPSAPCSPVKPKSVETPLNEALKNFGNC